MEDLETAALRVVHLEKCADDAHKLAQQLNKDGRFAEAQVAYAEMHRLEDEASILTKQVGCVACVLGDPTTDDPTSSCPTLDLEELQRYEEHYQPQPWPVQEGSNSSSGWEDRALGCIIGSSVADAAATGVHWIYDLEALAGLQHEREMHQAAGSNSVGLEFMDPPRSPFYSYAVGRNSPYGEQAVLLLESLEEEEGLSCLSYASAFQGAFGEGWDGYRDVSTKGFLRNIERGLLPPNTGAPDAQANCIARLAPLAAAFSGDAQLMTAVECATRVTQNSDAAVAWACTGAAVLEALLLRGRDEIQAVAGHDGRSMVTGPMESAVRGVMFELQQGAGRLSFVDAGLASTIAGCLQQCLDLASTPVPEATHILGRNCHMPNALQTPLQVVLHVEWCAASASSAPTASLPSLAAAAAAAAAPVAPVLASTQQHLVKGSDSSLHGSSHAPATAVIVQAEAAALHSPQSGVDETVEGKGQAASEARYVQAVRLAIREGGCCASRASFVGACVGALDGLGAVPPEWCGKHLVHEAVARGAKKLVVLRAVHQTQTQES